VLALALRPRTDVTDLTGLTSPRCANSRGRSSSGRVMLAWWMVVAEAVASRCRHRSPLAGRGVGAPTTVAMPTTPAVTTDAGVLTVPPRPTPRCSLTWPR
jgi:hypothetical protein